MHAIIDTNHRIAFPPLPNAALLDAIQRCLDRNPRTRIGMQARGLRLWLPQGVWLWFVVGGGNSAVASVALQAFHALCRSVLPPGAPCSRCSPMLCPASAPGLCICLSACLQELLEHPFLRPTHAAAAAAASAAASRGSSVELSRDQLTKLLQQVAAAGVSGGEVGHLSDQLFRQLASGLSPDLISRKVAAAAEARAVAPAPRAAPQQQAQPRQQQPASVAAAAAQAAAARSSQRADAVAALESRPRAAAVASSSGAGAAPAAGSSGRAALMPISQLAIAQQAAALRKVEPAQKQAAARQPESGLEAALRKGESGRGAAAGLPCSVQQRGAAEQPCNAACRCSLPPPPLADDASPPSACLQAWSASNSRTVPRQRRTATPLAASATSDWLGCDAEKKNLSMLAGQPDSLESELAAAAAA
jgi:hypothetical protein